MNINRQSIVEIPTAAANASVNIDQWPMLDGDDAVYWSLTELRIADDARHTVRNECEYGD